MKYFIAACMAVSCWLFVPVVWTTYPQTDGYHTFGEFGRLVLSAVAVPVAALFGLMPAAFIYWMRQRKQPQ